jgi:hypothetical protein
MLETLTRTKTRESRSERVLFKGRPFFGIYAEYYGPDIDFVSGSFESEFEEVSVDAPGSRHVWKPFQHYKRWTSPESVGGAFTHIIGDQIADHCYRVGEHKDPYWAYPGWDYRVGVYGPTGAPFTGLQPLYAKAADGGFVPLPAELSALKQRSLDQMLPGIKPELSLINSFIELKDFKTLPRTLTGIGKYLFAKGKTLRQLLRVGSDSYLQAQFNILPLLSDISGIHAALLRTSSRINDLVARQGRVQRRHFAYVWDELLPDTYYPNGHGYRLMPGIFPGLTDVADTVVKRLVVNSASVFHGEIQFNYNYTGYQAAHAQLFGLLDALGVQPNPAIIWNAIPWSFVVDWVFGVSRWLNQYKYSLMEPVTNILGYLWSISRKRTVYLSLRNAPMEQMPPWWYWWYQGYPSLSNTLPGVHESAYRREVGLPTISSILSSGLSPKEFSLGAALVLSRKYSPRRARRWKVK